MIKKLYDVFYLEMFGMPFFIPFASMYLSTKKTIMAIHNVHVPKGGRHAFVAKLYRDFTVKHFENFQTFSESQKKELKKIKKAAHVCSIPFVLKDYGHSSKVRNTKQITFLNFGNIRPYKRIDVLIKAAQKAYEETNIVFKVIIAGNCDDWKLYDQLIRYPQLFDLRIERIENDQIPDLFAESDYFVAPYQDIAQSGSSIIAINYDLPIIASELDSFTEYITNGKNGFLFRPADELELTKIMVYILTNHDSIYAKLRDNVSLAKNNCFSIESIKSKYLEMFGDL